MDEEKNPAAAKKRPLDRISFPMLLTGLVCALIIILVSVTYYVMPRPNATIKVVMEPVSTSISSEVEVSQ